MIPLPSTWTYEHLDQVSSTMDQAKVWLKDKDSNHFPHIIHADHQTNGYGQQGRTWVSGEGNLYTSLIFPLNFPLKIIGQLSIATIVAIGETLDQLGYQGFYRYKWPNDLFINNRKVGGVLIEVYPNQSGNSIIVGIGLNIKTVPDFNAEYQGYSLKDSHPNLKTTPLIFLEKFSFIYQKILIHWQDRGFHDIQESWTFYSQDINKPISYQTSNLLETGIFLGIDENGFAMIKKANGQIKLFQNRTFR